MRLAEWLASFRALHDRARRGELRPQEITVYAGAREELARALLAAQRVQVKPGLTARGAVRVARALQADLEVGGRSVRAMTLDLAIGGFGALLATAPSPAERAEFMLRLPGGVQVRGVARVAGIVPSAGSARVAFAFEEVAAADLEQIEMLVFDTLLEQLKAEAGK